MIEKLLARLATHRIVVISNQQFEEINGRFRIGRKDQFKVIPLGIDLDVFSETHLNRDVLRGEIGADRDDVL